jgi:hypothetical protein
MTTRIGTHRVSARQPVRLDPRAKYAGDPPTLEQQITKTQTDTYKLIDTLLGHISDLRQRVDRLERTRR